MIYGADEKIAAKLSGAAAHPGEGRRGEWRRREDVEGPLAEERKLVSQAKKLGLFAAGSATQKYMQAIQDQQEIMGSIADIVTEVYAMESALLRAQKIVEQKGEAAAALPIAMTRVYLTQAMDKVESAARSIVGLSSKMR